MSSIKFSPLTAKISSQIFMSILNQVIGRHGPQPQPQECVLTCFMRISVSHAPPAPSDWFEWTPEPFRPVRTEKKSGVFPEKEASFLFQQREEKLPKTSLSLLMTYCIYMSFWPDVAISAAKREASLRSISVCRGGKKWENSRRTRLELWRYHTFLGHSVSEAICELVNHLSQ